MQVQLLGSLNGGENWYLARPSGFFRVSGWPTGCLVDLLYCSVCSSRCPAATATLTTHIKSRKTEATVLCRFKGKDPLASSEQGVSRSWVKMMMMMGE